MMDDDAAEEEKKEVEKTKKKMAAFCRELERMEWLNRSVSREEIRLLAAAAGLLACWLVGLLVVLFV